MTNKATKAKKYGYLLIVEGENQGLTGGYLIVSDRGRPLEFHCTETLHSNRAQEILFGPTLRSYLIGDQISGALLKRAEFKVDVLLVNDQLAVDAGERQGIATACLSEEEVDIDSLGLPSEAAELLTKLNASIEINEPFGRVREAVQEACRFHDDGASHAAA